LGLDWASAASAPPVSSKRCGTRSEGGEGSEFKTTPPFDPKGEREEIFSGQPSVVSTLSLLGQRDS